MAGVLGVLLVVGGIVGATSFPRRSSSGAPGTDGGGTASNTPSSLAPGVSDTASSAGLRYGPGPQATYTVEPQPPAASCRYGFQGSDPLPDPHCTPGVLNPQVTQATIASTICRRGYTSSIRPSESITEPEKRGSAAAYSYSGPFSTGEYDHLVPLELGGDPNDPGNLWVEPNDNPTATSTDNSKDVLENRLNALVCSGQLSLAGAQQAISADWATAYQRYVGSRAGATSPPPSASPTPSGSVPPGGSAFCTASAAPANDGYSGDYYVTVDSSQPGQKATATDAGNSWSDTTDASGYVRILLYHTAPGEQIDVVVGAASCSTTA